MPDIYGADYASKIDSAARYQCAVRKDDPYLLGYFIGNEQPWPGREVELINTVLTGAETPIQTELKKYLVTGDTPERRKPLFIVLLQNSSVWLMQLLKNMIRIT